MPVSKKPGRAKSQSQDAPAPDLQAIESFLAALIAHAHDDDAVSQAQDIMYDAWDHANKRSRIALARKALKVSPLCADAYVLLAEDSAKSPEEARDLFARGVEAGEASLGRKGFKEFHGHFWGFLETRPYMRARAGLATALLAAGDTEGAIGHFRAMLDLNPNDNQGMRYALLACLLQQNDQAAVISLLDRYADEFSAFWLYTRLLCAVRSGRQGDEKTAALIQDAVSANEYVPAILAGTMPGAHSENGYMMVGGADEATEYVDQCGAAWRLTPGAIEWLSGATAQSTPHRKRPAGKR